MPNSAALALNSGCYCWPVARDNVIAKITAQEAASNMAAMLSERPHYFANTSIFLSPKIIAQMKRQIRAIEDVIKLPNYVKAVNARGTVMSNYPATDGVFMGYDFHITDDVPRLIEINSNAGGAFIVDMIEQAVGTSKAAFGDEIYDMFQSEWAKAGRTSALKTIAIVDTNPQAQYHYPDMCLAKRALELRGVDVVITDPEQLRIESGHLFHENQMIDIVYNRLTDFDLSEPVNAVMRRAYKQSAAVITPAPHHHALYADKRNLITLSSDAKAAAFGATNAQREALALIPTTTAVTPENAEAMWKNRRHLFFKPQSGFGSRGAFRGAKLTKKVWGEILEGGYIAQELVAPPIRAVTVDGEQTGLKFDVRAYTYAGSPILYAARIYQGQTTNLRTAGGGLAAVIPIENALDCH